MCGSLQLTTGEWMKTPEALKKLFPESGKLPWMGFARLEGIKIIPDEEIQTWGTDRWHGTIHKFLAAEVAGFEERGKGSKRGKLKQFTKHGEIIAAVVQHWQHSKALVIVTTSFPEGKRALNHDRQPLILTRNLVAA